MKANIRQTLFLLSLIVLVGNGVLGYAVYKSDQKLLDSEQWVKHSEEVIYQSGNILSAAKDIETSSRGFVITANRTFLAPLFTAEKVTSSYISQLRRLTLDNPSQQQRIDSLDYYMHRLMDFSFKMVELRSNQGLAAAVAYTSVKQGKYYTDRILQITRAFQQEERTLLKSRKQTNERSVLAFNRFSLIMFFSMAGFTILLLIVIGKYLFQNKEKEKGAAELAMANKELSFQNEEKGKRAAELTIANQELSFQNEEKGKRAAELTVANAELLYQNEEKGKRAAELTIANEELSFQNEEKEKRADELAIANEELLFQNNEKEKRAAELAIANEELLFQNEEKEKRAAELAIANIERTKMVNDLMLRNKDLEQFAYIISHNLRAPVANILGASSALNDLDLCIEDKEVLTRGINTSVMRLDDVVQDLNSILQIKGSINETKEIVRFSELIEIIKDSIVNIADKYIINIKYDFSEINEFLTLKPYFYSIFYNLISNSIKYRRQGIGALIEITSRRLKNKLELIFTDNGIGIDLEKNGDNVFGLYKRFHSHIEGKGMGLFMVKTQVETLGGKINIHSIENEGTEFKIEFDL